MTGYHTWTDLENTANRRKAVEISGQLTWTVDVLEAVINLLLGSHVKAVGVCSDTGSITKYIDAR